MGEKFCVFFLLKKYEYENILCLWLFVTVFPHFFPDTCTGINGLQVLKLLKSVNLKLEILRFIHIYTYAELWRWRARTQWIFANLHVLHLFRLIKFKILFLVDDLIEQESVYTILCASFAGTVLCFLFFFLLFCVSRTHYFFSLGIYEKKRKSFWKNKKKTLSLINFIATNNHFSKC